MLISLASSYNPLTVVIPVASWPQTCFVCASAAAQENAAEACDFADAIGTGHEERLTSKSKPALAEKYLPASVAVMPSLACCHATESSVNRLTVATRVFALLTLLWLSTYTPICSNFRHLARLCLRNSIALYAHAQHNSTQFICTVQKLFPGGTSVVCCKPHIVFGNSLRSRT